MSDISGIPNMGIPALSGFNGGGGVNGIPGSNGLNDAFAQQAMNNRFFQNQADTLQSAHVPQSQLYGGGFFGAQPAHFAGVGAAYGRATGGFGGYGAPNADPMTPVPQGGNPSGHVTRGPDLPDLSPSMPAQPPVPYLSGGGMPFGGGGFGRNPTVFDTGTSGIPNLSGGGAPFGGGGFNPSGGVRDQIAQRMMGAFDPGTYAPAWHEQAPPSGSPRAPQQPQLSQNWDSYFGDVTSQAPGSRTPSGGEASPGFPWGGTAGPGSPSSQRLVGYDPAKSEQFAPGGGNQFAGRFGFRNAGTPSEYTTSPYEDAQGQTHQPSQLPPGFSSPYGFDNPGGALGRGGFRGSQAPIMNSSEGEDTLTAQDAMAPHSFTAVNGGPQGTGSFDPSAFNPSQFAPGSPFGSGRGARAGVGTINPSTSLPFFGGEGSGFGTPGSTQGGGQYAGTRRPNTLGQPSGFIGTSQDAYGNPFIQGNAPPFAQGQGRMGGGAGLGGLDLLGQGTVFRGR